MFSRIKTLLLEPVHGRPFLFVLFLFLEIFIVGFFINDHRGSERLNNSQILKAFASSYHAAIISYDYSTRMIFDDVVNQPEVLKLMASALDNPGMRASLRNKLYQLMIPSYERQTAIGFRQFHFHLKDGTSFLRMHARDKFGDSLFPKRVTVHRANIDKKRVTGFDLGFFADGYRYVYPLSYNNRHIGSVEFVLTSEGILNIIRKLYPGQYYFMLNKSAVDDITYSDWKNSNYKLSDLSEQFFIAQKTAYNDSIVSINQKLRGKVSERLAAMERFVAKESVNGSNYQIAFLPVNDINGSAVAYFVQYLRDDFTAHNLKLEFLDIILFSIFLGVVFYSIDNIQSRRKTLLQKNLELSQMTEELQRYKLLSRHARDIILFINSDGQIIEANESAEKAYGYSREELVSLSITDLRNTQTLQPVKDQMSQAVEQGILFETEHRRSDGSLFPVEVSSIGINIGGSRILLNIIRDITGRKQTETQIINSLREKETLLREIHHRVKNNLAVISSLLELQADRIQDPELRGFFDESRQRIKSIALVHEKLYGTADMSLINFSDYIQSIVMDLLSLYQIRGRDITTRFTLDDIRLDVDTAIPCGLIINELVTNSLKHAFPDRRNGELSIFFTKSGSSLTLKVEDNGIGLPDNFDHKQTGTLGLQLVNALTRQLRGNVQFLSDNGGSTIVITFTFRESGNG